MTEKILVIDDEPLILKTIERALSKKGYEVITTSDAGSFLSALRETKADLLIMDLHLGGFTADELMDEVNRISPDSKILIMSGGVPEHEETNFLEKPFKIEELRDMVRLILDRP